MTPSKPDTLAEVADDLTPPPSTVSWPPMDHVFRELETLEDSAKGDLASLLWTDDEAPSEVTGHRVPALDLEEALSLDQPAAPLGELTPPPAKELQTTPLLNASARAGFFLNGAFEQAAVFLLTGIPPRGDVLTLVAPAGMGKTAMCGFIQTQAPENVDLAFVPSASLSATRTFLVVCGLLNVKFAQRPPNSEALLAILIDHIATSHKKGHKTVVIIDEAQDLSPYVLVQLRLLAGLVYQHRYPLRIVLVGRPELDDHLERPEVAEIVQRISGRYELSPFDEEDTKAYIDFRLTAPDYAGHPFDGAAKKAICENAGGIPGVIEQILQRCIATAEADNQKSIDGPMAQRAAVFVGRVAATKPPRGEPATTKQGVVRLPRTGTRRRSH